MIFLSLPVTLVYVFLHGWDGVGHGNRRGHLFLARTVGHCNSDRVATYNDWEGTAPVAEESFQEGRPLSRKETVAFTDGCKKYDGQCGFGVVVRMEGFDEVFTNEGGLGCCSSVMQAEIFAIQQLSLIHI